MGRKASRDQLRSRLAAQSPDHLVDLLCSHAEEDSALRQRLELEAAAQRVGGLDTVPFLAALDRAIWLIDVVEEDEVPTYAHRVGELLCSVGDLLDHGHPRAGHAPRACCKARLDPEELAPPPVGAGDRL